MMVKRAMVSQEQIEKAKLVLKKGFSNITGEIQSGEYLRFIHSKECLESVKALAKYIKFAFVKPLSGVTQEDKNAQIFLTLRERQDVISEMNLLNIEDLYNQDFYRYIQENSFESEMNGPFGSIQVRFSIDPDIVEELGYVWDYDNFTAVEVPFVNFILPYWFNFIRFDQFTVNEESKPGITVQEVAKVLIEAGMSYCDKEKDKAYDMLFEEEMKFVLIDEVESVETSIEREWKKGKLILSALEKDNVLKLKVMLTDKKDYLMDFPQGNSLISMAVKFKADNCLDFLLENGASLLRTPGGTFSNLSTEAYRSVFWGLTKFVTSPSFAWYRFFIEYIKKEVSIAKQKGEAIPQLKEKIDLIAFHLSLDNRWEAKFWCNYINDFVYSVLDEDEASYCIVANFYSIEEAKDLFLQSLKVMPQRKVNELLSKSVGSLYLVYKILKYRKVNPVDVIIEGKNLKHFLEVKYTRTNELIKQINTFWKT